MPITQKQRQNAYREQSSIVCAGCAGMKNRGAPFCRKCEAVLWDKGFTPTFGPVLFAEKYTERLEYLLSRRGVRERKQAA